MSFLIFFIIISIVIYVPWIYFTYFIKDILNMFEIINETGSLRYYTVVSFMNNKTYDKIQGVIEKLYIKGLKLDKVTKNNIINFKNYTDVFQNLSNIIYKLQIEKQQEIESLEIMSTITSIITLIILFSTMIIIFIFKNRYKQKIIEKNNKLKNYINSDNHLFHLIKNDYFIIDSLLRDNTCNKNHKELIKILEIGMANCRLRNILYKIISESYIINYENISIKKILTNNIIKFDIVNNKQNIQNIISDKNIIKIILQNIYSNIIKHGKRPYILTIKNINNNIIFIFNNDNKIQSKECCKNTGLGLESIKLCCKYLKDTILEVDIQKENTQICLTIMNNFEIIDNSPIKNYSDNENNKFIKKNIIFFDDNKIIRKIFTRYQKYFPNYNILVYGTIEDIKNLRNIIINSNPILIILDNNLGYEFTGLEIARKLVIENIVKKNQIVLFSGDSFIDKIEFEFIDKSLTFKLKISKIRNILNNI